MLTAEKVARAAGGAAAGPADREKAAETYRKGAGLFPQNEELARKSGEAEEK